MQGGCAPLNGHDDVRRGSLVVRRDRFPGERVHRVDVEWKTERRGAWVRSRRSSGDCPGSGDEGVAGCNNPIETIAGLRKLAEDRALYVAYEIGGTTYRGQLWPRGQLERNGTASALATSAQVVDASEPTSSHKVVARLRLLQELEKRGVHGFGVLLLHPVATALDHDCAAQPRRAGPVRACEVS